MMPFKMLFAVCAVIVGLSSVSVPSAFARSELLTSYENSERVATDVSARRKVRHAKRHKVRHTRRVAMEPQSFAAECYSIMPCEGVDRHATVQRTVRVAHNRAAYRQRLVRQRQAYASYAPEISVGYSANRLVERARAYMGTNPTGWSRVWCGRFMAMIAPEAARRVRNPNWARDWVEAGSTSHYCQVGSIAVLSRGRGGHVGVVSGCTPQGPQIVSGNHNRRVGEGVYDARRVLAYVVPR